MRGERPLVLHGFLQNAPSQLDNPSRRLEDAVGARLQAHAVKGAAGDGIEEGLQEIALAMETARIERRGELWPAAVAEFEPFRLPVT